MIGIITYQSTYIQQFKYPYGTLLTQISNTSNLTDILVCKDVIYQILQNGTVQAIGNNPSILGNKTQYDFVNLNIMNAKKLFCYKDIFLWYISITNELFFEQFDEITGLSIFTQSLADDFMPTGIPIHNIKQIVGNDVLQFVLTSNSIYVTGTQSVRYIFNGDATGIDESYLKLPLVLNASNIESIDLTPSIAYLFVYMNNGDVYALGDNTKGVLTTSDSKCERKVGANITRVSVGFNQMMIRYTVSNRVGNLRVHKMPNQITPSNYPIKSANQIYLQIILSNFSQSTQSQATAARCWLREFFIFPTIKFTFLIQYKNGISTP
ncbi:Regulator_of chromosome condensation 1/beta-lactamase-inhibitor protein II [Hexamita inflata]|uniref:Regulator of chromosome condensation 1/beta-lactamase-inhibitor protein II n=1 Tax=Hexamita inflata TaxID=28002 RepID=A0AA86V1G0_9EUKA|nr:Regulator of chromosome condensation 1/beta-lactamase-inhibitor protein II [Hexamita inflata]